MSKHKTGVGVDNISHRRLTPLSIVTIAMERLNNPQHALPRALSSEVQVLRSPNAFLMHPLQPEEPVSMQSAKSSSLSTRQGTRLL
jgi:hypothetical protein